MDEYTKDLYTMMFSLQTLQNQGITIRETVYKSLDKLLLWNKESENSKYLELALLHMQAYANMGFALDEENKTIREILKKTGKTREDFFPMRSQTSRLPPAAGAGSVKVSAAVPGKVVKIVASVGQSVKAGDSVVIVESMKMEIPVVAPQDGTIASIDVAEGAAVENGDTLATMN